MDTISLQQVPLPNYYAISYTWGDASDRTDIEVDGRTLSVPTNTAKAIHQMHRHILDKCSEHGDDAGSQMNPNAAGCRIWIDAICINQTDGAERAQQVSSMRKIYQNARSVFAWLGEDPEGVSDEVVHLLGDLRERCLEESHNLKYFINGHFPSYLVNGQLPSAQHWDTLKALYSSPWFRRIWTVQEMVLARDAFCVFGQSIFQLERATLPALWLAKREYQAGASMLSPMKGIEQAASRFLLAAAREEPQSLTSVLKQLIDFDATDPRDLIYGVLALVKEDIAYQYLSPDYKLSVESVNARSTVRCIQESRTLEPLQLAAVTTRTSGKFNFPSWVMRFGGDDKPLAPTTIRPMKQAGTLDSRFPDMLNKLISSEWRVLELAGIKRDVVSEVVPFGLAPEVFDQNFNEWMVQVRSLAAAVPRSVLYRTIAAGVYASSRSAQHRLERELCNIQKWGTHRRTPISFRIDKSLDFAFAQCQHQDRCFFTTSSGRIGLGVPSTKPGDTICALDGAAVPFILREQGPHWRLVGDAYVEGILEVSASEWKRTYESS